MDIYYCLLRRIIFDDIFYNTSNVAKEELFNKEKEFYYKLEENKIKEEQVINYKMISIIKIFQSLIGSANK
jgi:hypothetical protein